MNDVYDHHLKTDIIRRRISPSLIQFVVNNFQKNITLADLAQVAEMSRFSFCRKFQKECGISPVKWLWSFRVMMAEEMIRGEPQWNLSEVAGACGFSSPSHFSRLFKQYVGLSPTSFRKASFEAKLGRANPQRLVANLLKREMHAK